MNETDLVRGVVINVHDLGATVRLEDGTLASVAAADVRANRPRYLASRTERTSLAFAVVERRGRRAIVTFEDVASQRPSPVSAAEPGASDAAEAAFEAQMTAYLKSTQTWAPPDRPEPAERHFIRKKRRAAFFEARKAET